MFLMQNLTGRNYSWYLKLLYIKSKKKKQIKKSWLDFYEIETKVI